MKVLVFTITDAPQDLPVMTTVERKQAQYVCCTETIPRDTESMENTAPPEPWVRMFFKGDSDVDIDELKHNPMYLITRKDKTKSHDWILYIPPDLVLLHSPLFIVTHVATKYPNCKSFAGEGDSFRLWRSDWTSELRIERASHDIVTNEDGITRFFERLLLVG